jgi:hypothetical protein
MRRACRALLAAALLAGLPGRAAPAPSPSSSATGAPLVVPWDIVDCTFAVLVVPAPANRLAPYLPEGFTLGVGARVPIDPAQATESACLGPEAFECGSGAGLDAPVLSLDYGSVFTFVEPPEALRNDTIQDDYVKWGVLVPDAPRREALAARGVPARAGNAEIELTRAAAGVQVRATLDLEGVGGFTLTGVGVEGAGAEGIESVECVPAAEGTLASFHAVAQERASAIRGNGVVDIAPGT